MAMAGMQACAGGAGARGQGRGGTYQAFLFASAILGTQYPIYTFIILVIIYIYIILIEKVRSPGTGAEKYEETTSMTPLAWLLLLRSRSRRPVQDVVAVLAELP